MNQDLPFRWFAGWAGMLIGLILGGLLTHIWYFAVHPRGIYIGGPPPLPLAYYLGVAMSSVAGAVVGLALGRWRDLPANDAGGIHEA